MMSLGTSGFPATTAAGKPAGVGRRWRRVGGAVLAAAVLVVSNGVAGSPPVGANPVPKPVAASPVPQGVPPHALPVPPAPVSLPAPPAYSAPLALPTVTVDPRGVQPAAFLQPEPKIDPAAKGQLPPPNPLPFGDDKVRLPRLGILGATPVPTEKDLEAARVFIEGVIDPRYTFDLIQGRARLILLKQTPTRTQIADPSVASFNILQPGNQMTVIGQREGITVLNLWFTDPGDKEKEVVLSYLLRVLPDPEAKERLEAIYKALELEINKAYPNSRVRLTLVGDKLMLSGQAHDAPEANQILRIVNANAPGAGGPATRPPLANISPAAGLGGVGADALNPLQPTATPGLESYVLAGANVINNLIIPGEQQVTLRVIVAEVDRAAARSIGVNFSVTQDDGTILFAQQTGTIANPNLTIFTGNNFNLTLSALRTLSYARSLAEPNLTALNGQTASFLAGGQFPVPVVGGGFAAGGVQGVQFVPFGVQVQFTPFISDRDKIRLQVTATVSTIDSSIGTNIGGGGGAGGGANVPGLNARTFSTVVDLRDGQTMAVAGLISTSMDAASTRVPLFGDLPFIGRLFKVDQIAHGERELVILVTPELVAPLERRELGPLPGSDIFEPGDLEFYLAGRLESRRSYDYRSPVMTDIHRMLNYRRCEQLYLIGPSGHVEPPDPFLSAAPKSGVIKK